MKRRGLRAQKKKNPPLVRRGANTKESWIAGHDDDDDAQLQRQLVVSTATTSTRNELKNKTKNTKCERGGL